MHAVREYMDTLCLSAAFAGVSAAVPAGLS